MAVKSSVADVAPVMPCSAASIGRLAFSEASLARQERKYCRGRARLSAGRIMVIFGEADVAGDAVQLAQNHLEGVSDGLTPDTWKERAGARGHSADLCNSGGLKSALLLR